MIKGREYRTEKFDMSLLFYLFTIISKNTIKTNQNGIQIASAIKNPLKKLFSTKFITLILNYVSIICKRLNYYCRYLIANNF
jgi:hypothetical protein